MYMEETTPEAEAEMLDVHAMPAARAVASARPDVIVFGCTSAGALRGRIYDDSFCQQIAAETKIKVVSVIDAVRRAIRSRNGRRIGVVTPYVDDLNAKIKASLEEDGELEVVTIAGLGITENFAIAEVTTEEIVGFATASLDPRTIDLAFVSCTNLRALDAVEELTARLDVPVVTSNLAALEETTRRLALHADASER
jgi:maleate isomerase